jgi:single-stranded DNA-binding protein
MQNVAEFTIIGRIGSIKTFGTTMRLSIASNYPFKDASGEWQEQTYWNQVTIFSERMAAYISKHISKGDLVHARGRMRQSSYERDGEKVYTVDLVCNQFARLAQASEKQDSTSEPSAPIPDDDVPF